MILHYCVVAVVVGAVVIIANITLWLCGWLVVDFVGLGHAFEAAFGRSAS